MNSKILFFFLVGIFMPRLGFAQLVNIESRRMQTDSIRFVLNADFSFDHANNDGVQVNQINGTLTTQLKSKSLRNIYLVLGNYQLIDNDGNSLQKSWFLHGRFNHKFTNRLSLEAFLQGQYNELLVVKQRNLTGLGLRFKFIDRENFSAYAGNSYMYEVEHSDQAQSTEYNHRNSTYVSLSYFSKSKSFSVANTFYYQPLYQNFGDYRLLEQLRFDFPLSTWLKVFATYNYYFDSKTPLNTMEYTSNLRLGLGVSL